MKRLLLCLLLLAFSSLAFAYNTGDEAYSACQTDRSTYLTSGRNIEAGLDCAYSTYSTNGARYWLKIGNTQMTVFEKQYTFPRSTCSTGKEWNATFNKCVTSAAQCAALAAKNDDPNSDMFIPFDQQSTFVGDGTYCAGGCAMAVDASQRQVATTEDVGFTRGRRHFTGASCGTPAPGTGDTAPTANPPKPTEPACKAALSGQTYCSTQDGKQCYTASTGRMICWNPGETGTKTDGNIAQQRQAGTATPPAPTPPPGETMSAQGPKSTTVTNTTVNNITSTTTTSVQNYVTQYGTNAGTVNQGQTQGSTSGGESSGSGGSASGTGNCDATPTCSGSAVDCAVFLETHNAACAGKKTNDFYSKTLTTAEQNGITGTDESPTDAQAAGVAQENEFDTADLNEDGFLSGGRTCPTVPDVEITVMGATASVGMPNAIECDWLAMGSLLVMAFAGLASLAIVAGGR